MVLLKFPLVLGLLVAVCLSLSFTCALFVTAHLLLRGKRPDQTRTFAQQMALRIGAMHALVVALVFSSLTGELIKLHNISDSEAISAANIYFKLEGNSSEEAARIRSLVPLYLKAVIEQDWEVLSETPHDLPSWHYFNEMEEINLDWKTSTKADEMLKGFVFDNLNSMSENRMKRIIEWQAPNLPHIFWVIAIAGFFLTLVPYLSVELNKLRFILICSYALMIGIMFYGIAVLDRPFLSRAIKPAAFEVILNGISAYSSSINQSVSKE